MAEVVASDGARLYAEAHGEGVPLVLSCALCTTHENWRPQVEPLTAAGARVILWDYRGHGRSESPEDERAYDIEQVVDDLAHVLDWAAGDTPAVVGGLSFGGLASLHLALRQPDRVRGLLLVDSGPGFKNPTAQAAWERLVEKTASFLERKGMKAFLEQAAPTSVGLCPDSPAARAVARAIAAQDPRGLARFARRVAAPAPQVIDRLGEIGVPALIVVGEKDEPYLRAAEVMEAKLRDAERVSIPGGGHIVNIDQTEAFNDVVARFLRKLTAPGPEQSG